MENKKPISLKEQKVLDEHFKTSNGHTNISPDFTNAYSMNISMIKDEKMLMSLGPIDHYDVYMKTAWPNMYELIMEKSNKETITKIDKLIDEYNSALLEKNNSVDKLEILNKIKTLTYSLKK
ncbi:MAG: hypothetical protein WC264_00710 [Candidatus Paceibacterota bacterium]